MTCPRCQTANPEGATFCLNCGAVLAAPRPVEGERKFVTVLFADVVGSTAMGERLDPEQVIDVMNGAFALLNTAVARYGGTVARLMGDAVLAFYGDCVQPPRPGPLRLVSGKAAALAAQNSESFWSCAGQRDPNSGCLDFRRRIRAREIAGHPQRRGYGKISASPARSGAIIS